MSVRFPDSFPDVRRLLVHSFPLSEFLVMTARDTVQALGFVDLLTIGFQGAYLDIGNPLFVLIRIEEQIHHAIETMILPYLCGWIATQQTRFPQKGPDLSAAQAM